MVVKCAWVTCSHNSSEHHKDPGYCKKDLISFKHIDNEDSQCNCSEELIEGLVCEDYERQVRRCS